MNNVPQNTIPVSYGKNSQKIAGMTLVEVVIAVSIFSMCMAGVCSLILQSRRVSNRARAHYVAINIAKNRLEMARTYDYSLLDLFIESNIVVDKNGILVNDGDFRRTTTVTEIKSNLTEMVIMVEIRNRNTWDFSGEEETVQSYFADYLEPPE